MKVLFFIHSLSSGGAERVLSLLANDWQAQGHEISIAIESSNIFYDIDKSIKIIDASIEQKGFAKQITGNVNRILKFKNIMTQVDPDIVISFMTTMCIKATIAAKLAKKPIILSEHTNFYFMQSKIWRAFRRMIYPLSNTLVVLTSHDKQKYSFHSNVNVIENPLALSHKHQKIERKNIILAVGRLTNVKGFDLLLKAFSQLENAKGWKLLILGEGPDKSLLEELASDLNISDQVLIPGATSDVEKHYKQASIFVLSSRMEGFPVSLCEAMGYGCPSVAFDCLTGPSDIIKHDHNGLLIEAGNTDMLSASIQDLIDNQDKRELLSKNAVTITKRLDIKTISNNWFEVITKTLNKNHSETQHVVTK